ncbi:hypothetical protein NQ315_017034 [Exocentrus adspersus]|uniref:C2H2-type domain-containing protein n=1 Tax=Exocentrus adspersus TaxID=1586481 RepID=A0AAV8V5B4_9CUCU|nr:hypothetical protein NQ315_017034 [Exocentrus adspersus]
MYSIKKFREIKTKKGNKKSDTVCVVCCKTCSKRDFEETGEVANEILDMLLLERDQTSVEGSVMCLKCFQKVNIIFEFKSACLYVEDFITPFVNTEEGNRIDLKEVYIRKKDNKDLVDALLGRDLCRLCMSVVDKGCVYLDSSDLHVKFVKEMIKRCIPEIGQIPVEEPVMCLKCFQKVNIIFEFKSACLYVEDFVTPFVNIEKGNRVDLKEVYIRKNDNKDLIFALLGRDLCRLCMSVVDNGCVYLDSSELHVKFVKEMIKRCIPEINVNNTRNAIVCGTCVGCLIDFCNFIESYSESRSSSRSQTTGRSLETDTELGPLPKNSLASSSNRASTSTLIEGVGPLGRESSSQKYQCGFCDYKSKLKSWMKSHSVIHKNPSEIEWFKCDLCDYKAKHKSNLTRHTVIHKDSSEIKWFECHLCDYKTKHKYLLNRHTVLHKNSWEIKWFECHLCDHKSMNKSYLNTHMLIHKNPSEIEWFECHLCDYKAKYKSDLGRHALTHKKPLGN